MSSPLAIFLRRMASHDDASVSAAQALLGFTEKNRLAVVAHAKDIAAYLHSPNLALRVIAACILSAINTEQSLDLLFTGFRQQPTELLLTDTTYSCYCPEPVAGWFVRAAYDTTCVHFQEARDDGLHRRVVSFLCEVAASKDTYPPRVRAMAMRGLYYYTQEYEGDVRATIKISQDVYDSACELAGHEDTEVASEAMQLLGHIAHRIESVPRAAVSTSMKQRIDFGRADLRDVVRQYGPYRFADVHPEDFEKIVARFLSAGGFSVNETSYIGDYGADLIASKGSDRIAVQVKRYGPTNPVGVGDVNQVIGAMQYYKCNKCLVITTSRFTASAIELAKGANVVLWDWDILVAQIRKVWGISV